MSLVYGGGNAVTWYAPKKDFPYVDGIVPIVISWFLSPIAAAIVCFVIFLLVRTLVLRRQNSTKLSFYVLPVLIIITIWVNLFFILVSDAQMAQVDAQDASLWILWGTVIQLCSL